MKNGNTSSGFPSPLSLTLEIHHWKYIGSTSLEIHWKYIGNTSMVIHWKYIKWLPIIPPQPHIGNISSHWKYFPDVCAPFPILFPLNINRTHLQYDRFDYFYTESLTLISGFCLAFLKIVFLPGFKVYGQYVFCDWDEDMGSCTFPIDEALIQVIRFWNTCCLCLKTLALSSLPHF